MKCTALELVIIVLFVMKKSLRFQQKQGDHYFTFCKKLSADADARKYGFMCGLYLSSGF